MSEHHGEPEAALAPAHRARQAINYAQEALKRAGTKEETLKAQRQLIETGIIGVLRDLNVLKASARNYRDTLSEANQHVEIAHNETTAALGEGGVSPRGRVHLGDVAHDSAESMSQIRRLSNGTETIGDDLGRAVQLAGSLIELVTSGPTMRFVGYEFPQGTTALREDLTAMTASLGNFLNRPQAGS